MEVDVEGEMLFQLLGASFDDCVLHFDCVVGDFGLKFDGVLHDVAVLVLDLHSVEVGLWSEIWGEERVSLLQGFKQGSDEVLSSSGLTGGFGVNIIDTSEVQDLLGDLGGNTTGTSWSWY